MWRHTIAFVALAGAMSPGLSAQQPVGQANATTGPGMRKETAIEVCGVDGERTYLKKLRCPDDYPPSFERRGNVGPRSETKTKQDEEAVLSQMLSTDALKPGEKDFHTIDQYDVVCRIQVITLYLDMYHCPESKSHPVPPGFRLKGQKQ
jgi:hypothetical protein